MNAPLAIFRDTVDPEAMPIDDTYQGVLAYGNGRYFWPAQQISRFVAAKKHLYRIDVNGSIPRGASILDVERYDATPADATVWVPRRNSFDHDAAVYCQLSTVPEVVDAVGASPCWLIVADWTGQPHIPELTLPGHVRLAGVQYENTPGWDLTAIYSAAWLAGRNIP